MAGRIAYLGNISPQGLVLDLDAGIKGSYPGVGTTWSDISNNSNNGTLTNGPTFTGSNYGAIVFDGVNDYALLNKEFMANAPAGTFNIWFNLSTTAGSAYSTVSNILIGKPSTPDNAFGFSPNTGNLLLRLGQTTNLTSTVSVNTGSWQLGQGVWNPTGMSIYQNGSPVASISTPGLTWFGGTTYDTVLGRNWIGSANGSFTGQMGGVKVYNQALTQFQVWQNFNAYKSRYGIPDIVTDGLILNLDAGNPYSYLSGSSGTTWTNTVAVSSSISGSLENGASYSNGAMVFDGTNDTVRVGNASNIITNPSAITVESWVKTNVVGFYKKIIITSPSGSQGVRGFYLSLGPAPDRLYFGVKTNLGEVYPSYGSNISTTQYSHIIGTYDSSLVKLYLNGNLVASQSLSGNIDTTGICKISGYDNNNETWNGNISNIKIYNRALTQAEITQNFNALRGRYGI
jgi:hypothetical protein